MPTRHADLAVADWVATTYADPLRFVLGAYPWGEPGPLAREPGPDTWQAEFLRRLGEEVRERGFDGRTPVAAIRRATSSGHGVGKSTLVAWLVNWIMSTRPHTKGTITANTFTQLRDKTWAAIQRWTALSITSRWFTVVGDRIYHTAYPASWFCAAQSSKEQNSEAFAGQHASDSTSFYVFDEASAVPDAIYEVAEGGLTDGEPMIFMFGNPTRSTGAFHRSCFGAMRDRWHPTILDARDCRFTNKAQIAEWISDYGENSDFVRVRVRGLPPAASDLQYIDTETVSAAQQRPPVSFPDDAIVCGLDVARGGADDCVFRFRRGADAVTIPPIRVPGAEARDSMRLVTLAGDVLGREYPGGLTIAMLFVDGTGIGGPIVDRLRQLGHQNVLEVQFGGEPPDRKYANMRAYMWGRMREWLPHGSIPNDPRLEQDLTGPGYTHDKQDRIVLEPKEHMRKRGVASPDDGDALALTFAAPVRARPKRRVVEVPVRPGSRESASLGWMG